MKSAVEQGHEFADIVRKILERALGIKFDSEVWLSVGNRSHPVDLVSVGRDWFVECKDLAWRKNYDYIPRAKIRSVTKDVEILQSLGYRGHKAIVLNRAQHPSKDESLAEYYFRLYKGHLGEVMLGEVDTKAQTLRWLK
jgi:DNA-binding sugar fermentation-stimulating protein